jgi:hypothetical protein
MLTMSLARGFGMDEQAAMKLGGALGIAGVAINIWVKNWDYVDEIAKSATWEDISFGFQDVADAARSSAQSVGEFFKSFGEATGVSDVIARIGRAVKGVTDVAKDIERDKAAKAEREKSADEAIGNLKSIKAEGSGERGAGFRKAIEQYGGGEKLAGDIYQGNFSGKQKAGEEGEKYKKKQQRNIALSIQAALGGDETSIASIAKLGGQPFGNMVRQHDPAEAKDMKQRVEFGEEQKKADEEFLKHDAETKEKAKHAMEREAERLAKALEAPIGKLLLADKNNNVVDQVRAGLTKSGMGGEKVDEVLGTVVDKLKKEVDKKVEERALDKGVTSQQARKDLYGEQVKKEKDEAKAKREKAITEAGGTKGEFTSGAAAIFARMQMRSTEEDVRKAQQATGKDRIPEDQLKEQKAGNKTLADIKHELARERATDRRARFGPRGG